MSRFKKHAISLNHSELNSIHAETKEATHIIIIIIIISGLLPIKQVTFMGDSRVGRMFTRKVLFTLFFI
jgi:hypothetical protein